MRRVEKQSHSGASNELCVKTGVGVAECVGNTGKLHAKNVEDKSVSSFARYYFVVCYIPFFFMWNMYINCVLFAHTHMTEFGGIPNNYWWSDSPQRSANPIITNNLLLPSRSIFPTQNKFHVFFPNLLLSILFGCLSFL